MPATQPSAKDSRTNPRGARRRRRAGASILVLGVIVLIAAFSTTNASAVNNEFLPSGTATTTLSCTGNDAVDGGLTTTILDAIGLNPVGLSATITSDPVDSPDTGDTFTMTFHWAFTLPQDLANTAVGLGTTDLLRATVFSRCTSTAVPRVRMSSAIHRRRTSTSVTGRSQ